MKPLGINTISTVKKITMSGEINTLKVVDSANDVRFVPIEAKNTDYIAVQAWAAVDGNTIAEADQMSNIVLKGSSSGDVTLTVPAAAGTNTVTVPAETGTVITTASNTGKILQVVSSILQSEASSTTQIPFDNTIPQNDEGAEFTTAAITAAHADNKFHVSVFAQVSSNGNTGRVIVGLFIDSTANALATAATQVSNSGGMITIAFDFIADAGDTSEHTFKMRYGRPDATTAFVNRTGSDLDLGNTISSGIVIREINTQ